MPLGIHKKESFKAIVHDGTYDETVTQFTNLGVLAALGLSFVLGLFFTVTQDEFFFGDYRSVMILSEDFREYAVNMLEKDNFNFTVAVPSNDARYYEYKDLREIINTLEDKSMSSNPYNCALYDPFWHCNDLYSEILIFVHMTYKSFDPSYLYSYCTWNVYECSLNSHVFTLLGGFSTLFLTLSLILSTVFYMALTLSTIRYEKEKGNMVPLTRFVQIAYPMIHMGYIMLTVAVFLFFLGLFRLLMARLPMMITAETFSLFILYGLLLPVGLALALFAFTIPPYALSVNEESFFQSVASLVWCKNRKSDGECENNKAAEENLKIVIPEDDDDHPDDPDLRALAHDENVQKEPK